MKNNVDVTIVIPVHNMEKYLPEALDSILGQKGVSFEIIVIDDASTDGSAEIIKKYEQNNSSVKAIFLEKNIGPGLARNIGIKEATGRYIRFMDPDDYYPENSLQKLLHYADENNADVAAGNIVSFDENRKIIIPKDKYSQISECGVSSISDNAAFRTPLHHHRFLFKRDFLVGNNITYPDLIRGQDPVMLAKVLVTAKDIYHIPDVVYVHRVFPGKTHSFNSKQIEDLITHFTEVIKVYKTNGLVRFGYLHLINRLWIFSEYNFNKFTDEELERLASAFIELFENIEINEFVTTDYSPFVLRSEVLWFFLGLYNKPASTIVAVLKHYQYIDLFHQKFEKNKIMRWLLKKEYIKNVYASINKFIHRK